MREKNSKFNLNSRHIFIYLYFLKLHLWDFRIPFPFEIIWSKEYFLEYRQFEPLQIDCRANNSEVVNSVALFADRNVRLQGLSSSLIHSWFQTPASETLFRTSVLTMADGSWGARPYIDIAPSVVYPTPCIKGDAVYEGCVPLRVRGECEARKMERGCHQPCKNKELVFFLVRKSVNRRDSCDPAVLRCIELMNVFRYKSVFQTHKWKVKIRKGISREWKKKKTEGEKRKNSIRFD